MGHSVMKIKVFFLFSALVCVLTDHVAWLVHNKFKPVIRGFHLSCNILLWAIVMSQPSSEPPDGSSSKKRTHPEDFKRAYKACINCRQRKAKCILDPSPGGELKPPCQRCKREMRECVFRSERSWVKRRKPGEPKESESAAAVNEVTLTTVIGAPQSSLQRTASISTHSMSPHDTPHGRRSDIMSPPATLRRGSTSQPNLAHSVMRTVVSSGSDALNLLFEAANHRDALENQEQVEGNAYETPGSGTSTHLGVYFLLAIIQKRDAFVRSRVLLRRVCFQCILFISTFVSRSSSTSSLRKRKVGI